MNRFFIICLMVFFQTSVFAAPHVFKLKPEPAVPRQGTPLRERLAPRLKAGRMLAPASYPTTTVNIVFLRVDFQKDEDPAASQTTGSGLWNDPLYSHGTPTNPDDPNDPAFNYWVNRAQTRFVEYWKEVSYGMLPIEVVISPKIYRLPQAMAYYGDESNSALENLIYDSVASASTDTEIDFTLFDAVLIVHAGTGEESDLAGDSTKDVWSLYYANSSISTRAQPDPACSNCLAAALRDGKPIREAIIMPQTDAQDGFTVDPLGVYVHEFGHWLGLPDLYCVGALCPDDGPDGVGKWSLMADGIYNIDQDNPTWYGSTPAYLDAWSKVKLGWVTPSTITRDAGTGVRTLNPVAHDPDIIKIQASTSASSQYFLLENRQRTGYDAGLPGHGLLIWLVDDAVVERNFASNTINNDKDRPGIKLIEADNDGNLLTYGCDPPGDCGSAGDPFPGLSNNIRFSPKTAPSSASYTASAWVSIKDISESDPAGFSAAVSADIGFTPLPPRLPGMSWNTVSWTPNAEPDIVAYNVYKNGVSVGQTPSSFYYDEGALNFDSYRVSAVNARGDESELSGQVIANLQSIDEGGERCFIATAAYGSALDPHVEALRSFRDRFLLTNAPGRLFVSYYYRYSPPAADFIKRNRFFRTATRWSLTPVVYAVEYPLMFIGFLFGGVVIVAGARRRLAG